MEVIQITYFYLNDIDAISKRFHTIAKAKLDRYYRTMRGYKPGMERRSRLAFYALAFVTGAVGPARADVSGSVKPLTTATATSTQSAPAISGSSVVWTAAERLANGTVNYDIWYLDLASGLPGRNITATPGEQEFLEDVDGTNVVFTHTGPQSAGDIIIYDTVMNTSTPVAVASRDGAVHYEQPAIKGRYVVYVRVGSRFDIAGYDYGTGFPLPAITNDAAVQARPRVGDDIVVYEDYGSGSADIYAYRISTSGPPFPVATGPQAQTAPDIDGNFIVWVESSGGDDQIMAYDLTTGATRQLTRVPSVKVTPRVSGNRVVWADDRGGDLDIYLYDLETDTEELLVRAPGDQLLTDIDGGRVVYQSNETGFEQIYLFTFAAPPPKPKVPLGCDPKKTDPYDAAVVMTRSSRDPVFASGTFSPAEGRVFYVCVENGKPDGTQRSGQFLFSIDGKVVLTASDFKPQNAPPRFVAAELLDARRGRGRPGHKHVWSAALFGAQVPSTATITVRVSK